MVKLHFTSTEEFETLFKNKSAKVTDSIVEGIQLAMQERKRTAPLFEISFQDLDSFYEISLPQSQWAVALQHCLDYYHSQDMTDQAIDTWKLLEAAKVW